MSIGEQIRRLRTARNLTQKELGALCGMADSAIRRYESGRGGNPTQSTLQRIANALEVPIGELLGMSDADAFVAEFDDKTQTDFLNDELKRRLDRSLKKLSDTGRVEAVKRVEELAYIPEYQKQKSPPAASQGATEGK